MSSNPTDIPHPVTHKRNRTLSQSEKILLMPASYGKVKEFCRNKGHGFIIPDNGDDEIFFHIYDIDGEYVPHADDQVEYRKINVPPKNKCQAAHVKLVEFDVENREKWSDPIVELPSF